MNDQLQPALEAIQRQVVEKEREVILPLKQAANQLCKIMNIDPVYDLSDDGSAVVKSKLTWRIDQFFNRPLASSVADILTARKDSGLEGPATVDEIYENLVQGGFKFEGATGSEDNQKRALKIAITKNTAQFVKIGENVFGMRTWYKMRAPRNGKKPEDGEQAGDDELPTANAESASQSSPEPKTDGELKPAG